MDIDHGIGIPADGLVILSLEEHESLARAVRSTIKSNVLDLLRRRGPIPSAELLECPSCGERVIHLDSPPSYVYDHRSGTRICKACGAQRDFAMMAHPEVDIGGEGG